MRVTIIAATIASWVFAISIAANLAKKIEIYEYIAEDYESLYKETKEVDFNTLRLSKMSIHLVMKKDADNSSKFSTQVDLLLLILAGVLIPAVLMLLYHVIDRRQLLAKLSAREYSGALPLA